MKINPHLLTVIMLNLLLPLLFILVSCSSGDSGKPPAGSRQRLPVAGQISEYHVLKTKSQALLRQYRRTASVTALNKIQQFICDSLMLPWYGTAWDFNGTTETPGEGKIACGYFVTTVLRDAGIPLNRVKLSQCASAEMIRRLCKKESIQSYSNISLAGFVKAVEEKGSGLYITGLDFHTGFLYHDGEKLWFIHASYAKPKQVIKEEALQSPVLASSAFRMVGRVNFD